MNHSSAIAARTQAKTTLRKLAPDAPPPVRKRIALYLRHLRAKFAAPPLYWKVLAAICGHARNEDGVCWPGTGRLARLARCHPGSVARVLRMMKEASVVIVNRSHPNYPGRRWVYVVQRWAEFWVDDDESAYRTRNSEESLNLRLPARPQLSRHSIAPLAKTAGRNREIERLRAEVDQADEDTREQAYACLTVGVHVPMTRWLLKHHKRGRHWIISQINRALEARNPAEFLISAIIEKWNWVSDVETYKRHASRSQSARKPQVTRETVDDVKARYEPLSDPQKGSLRAWLIEHYAAGSHVERWVRAKKADDEVWIAMGRAMTEIGHGTFYQT